MELKREKISPSRPFNNNKYSNLSDEFVEQFEERPGGCERHPR